MIRSVAYLVHNMINKIFERLAAIDTDAGTDTAIQNYIAEFKNNSFQIMEI